jgi:hypothetical protein
MNASLSECAWAPGSRHWQRVRRSGSLRPCCHVAACNAAAAAFGHRRLDGRLAWLVSALLILLRAHCRYRILTRVEFIYNEWM